ncbi:hypothetical protein HD554DRAFT_1774613 [Boletus coccyginus]|nr:hypothetical protein HD554DRAFT_1774613 [Boletus coccyginus]
MATTNTALPPMDKISMIGIWAETMLYGVNCVMYALCTLILLRGDKVPSLRWVLVAMSTIHILLATVHVGASLQQLLDAFVYAPPDVPDYSTIYWLDYSATPMVLKDNLYNTLVFTQDFILIWRLYVVFVYDWRVIVFPIVLEAACIGVAYSGTAMVSDPNVGLYGSVVTSDCLSAWVLDITLNVSITTAIAGRLWWMGRTTSSLTSRRTNRYAFPIYVIVECGAIFTGANTICLLLYAWNNPGLSTGLGITSQLATLTPLLIVVQIGLTGQHRFSRNNHSRTVPTVQDEFSFRVEIPEDSQQDLSLHTIAALKHQHSVPNSSQSSSSGVA